MTVHSVLIIDDSPISRKILRSCLPRDRAFTIAEAADGAAGLQAFQAKPPDVTFLDLTMPRMAGLECLERMRALAPRAIIVVITADVQARSISRALELGAEEVLHKPPTPDAVAGVLRRLDAMARGQDAV